MVLYVTPRTRRDSGICSAARHHGQGAVRGGLEASSVKLSRPAQLLRASGARGRRRQPAAGPGAAGRARLRAQRAAAAAGPGAAGRARWWAPAAAATAGAAPAPKTRWRAHPPTHPRVQGLNTAPKTSAPEKVRPPTRGECGLQQERGHAAHRQRAQPRRQAHKEDLHERPGGGRGNGLELQACGLMY